MLINHRLSVAEMKFRQNTRRKQMLAKIIF